MSDKTPYQRGFEDGKAGKAAPPFSAPDSSWWERLYERGWSAGIDARTAEPHPEKQGGE